MNKKGAEISINVIIVAAIAMLVLVIVSIIFIGRIGPFSTSVVDCENKGGKCVLSSESCPDDYPVPYAGWQCEKLNEENQKCCIQVEVS